MALRYLRKTWDQFGRNDPLWAILTHSGKKGNRWDLDEFFQTGRDDIARLVAYLDRVAPWCRRGSALDFGCGIGRLTLALADHFDEVVGVDVARPMITRADELNPTPDRCRFVLNRSAHLRRFADGTFDLVYSRIVLQHMQPPLVRRYLPELIRVLRPGGALVFQLPDTLNVDPEELFRAAPVEGRLKQRLPRHWVWAWRSFKYRIIVGPKPLRMEMFGMPRDEVEAVILAAGGRLVDVQPDHSHGTDDPGWQYCVTR
jgi:SAM-dependent methyltransferase